MGKEEGWGTKEAEIKQAAEFQQWWNRSIKQWTPCAESWHQTTVPDTLMSLWVGLALWLWLKQLHFKEHFPKWNHILNPLLLDFNVYLSPSQLHVSSNFLISLSPLMLPIYAWCVVTHWRYTPPQTLLLPQSIANHFSARFMGIWLMIINNQDFNLGKLFSLYFGPRKFST